MKDLKDLEKRKTRETIFVCVSGSIGVALVLTIFVLAAMKIVPPESVATVIGLIIIVSFVVMGVYWSRLTKTKEELRRHEEINVKEKHVDDLFSDVSREKTIPL